MRKKKTAKGYQPGEHVLPKCPPFTPEVFVEKWFILTEAFISNVTEKKWENEKSVTAGYCNMFLNAIHQDLPNVQPMKFSDIYAFIRVSTK